MQDTTRALASFVDTQLPELQEKKRLIDAHMNIATELLSHIRARSIDSYYAIEEAIIEGRPTGGYMGASKAFYDVTICHDAVNCVLFEGYHTGGTKCKLTSAAPSALR